MNWPCVPSHAGLSGWTTGARNVNLLRMKGSARNGILRVCILALVMASPLAALADGMVISEKAYAVPEIPDQQALIHYADGAETLVRAVSP
jgi:hypothetical protein